jgi:hypothetical protein
MQQNLSKLFQNILVGPKPEPPCLKTEIENRKAVFGKLSRMIKHRKQLKPVPGVLMVDGAVGGYSPFCKQCMTAIRTDKRENNKAWSSLILEYPNMEINEMYFKEWDDKVIAAECARCGRRCV